MPTPTALSIRPVQDADRQPLANLIHFETHVHRHLDWRSPLDWIGCNPFLIAEAGGTLVGALVLPPDSMGIAWIQLFAVSSAVHLQRTWQALWAAARQWFTASESITIAAMPLQAWFDKLLQTSGFRLTHRVVVMVREHSSPPPENTPPNMNIRPMNFDDLTALEDLDSLAFAPIWRNSREALMLAFQQAAFATVSEINGAIAGYQISTANQGEGHLARLAVHPRFQGMGCGSALLHDTLIQFEKRGARRLTVSTQQDNLVSLALYRKAGFQATREGYPVYQYHSQ